MDINLMNSDQELMNILTNKIDNIYKLHTGIRKRPSAQESSRQKQDQRTQQDAWSKQVPNKQEVLQELQKTYEMIGGTRTNLYDYARKKGLNDDLIYSLIKAKFGTMAPQNWDTKILVDVFGARHSALW